MRSLLFHGTCNISDIISSGCLFCNSFPEYSFPVASKVLSLTRSYSFAKYYASQERDGIPSWGVIVIDRELLNRSHKIYLGRSTLFDDDPKSRILERSECEEFVVTPISLNHPSVIHIEKQGNNNASEAEWFRPPAHNWNVAGSIPAASTKKQKAIYDQADEERWIKFGAENAVQNAESDTRLFREMVNNSLTDIGEA